ncbi:MAG: hypothetical protein ABW146_16295 [Candidatus Sedimenticola sp. 6PFRAG7]
MATSSFQIRFFVEFDYFKSWQLIACSLQFIDLLVVFYQLPTLPCIAAAGFWMAWRDTQDEDAPFDRFADNGMYGLSESNLVGNGGSAGVTTRIMSSPLSSATRIASVSAGTVLQPVEQAFGVSQTKDG